MASILPQGEIMGRSEGANFIPEIWSAEIFRYRAETLILAQYVKRLNFNGGVGDYLRMPKINRLGVNDKLPKQPVRYQATAGGRWDMKVDRYKESSFMIEDILQIQSNVNLRSEYTAELGVAMARDMDNAILAHRASFVNVPGSHITTAGALDDAKILAAIETLDIRRVPKQGRVLIVAPAQHADLISGASRFINGDFIGQSGSMPLNTGMVGSVYGIPVVISDNITVNSLTGFTNGDDDLAPSPTPGMTGSLYYPTQFDITAPGTLAAGRWSAMLLTMDALAMAVVKMPSVEQSRDIDYQADKVVTTQIYGIKPWREDGAIVISTD